MEGRAILNYKQLIVWQKSIVLLESIYKTCKKFPQSERYSLESQLKRATISISSNIAEGKARKTAKDFRRFLVMSYGSATEVENLIFICKRLDLISNKEYRNLSNQVTEVLKMLGTMIHRLKT